MAYFLLKTSGSQTQDPNITSKYLSFKKDNTNMDIRPVLYFKTPDHKIMLEVPIINMPKANEKEHKGKIN